MPVILNVYDGYMYGGNAFDLAIDVEETFELISQMSWCHQSQIREWLPWVGRHNMEPPASLPEWSKILRQRFDRKNRDLGVATPHALEFFTVTAWGEIPSFEQLCSDFPGIDFRLSNGEALKKRLQRWKTV